MKVKTKEIFSGHKFKYFDDQIIGQCLNQDKLWEPALTDYISKRFLYLTDKQTFIDIGAHVGYFSVLWASLADNIHEPDYRATIWAFEPKKENFSILEENLIRFDCDYHSIKFFDCAIGIKETEGTLICDKKNTGKNEVHTNINNVYLSKEQTIEPCYIKKITSFDIDWDDVNLIKIDTEGGEDQIIKSMWDLLMPGTQIIVEENYEVNKFIEKTKVYVPYFIRNRFILPDGTVSKDQYHIDYVLEKE